MLAEVKRCVEAHDIKGLRYIFVDCLDVDPTFEKYRGDYEYCKSIPGLFDSHQELSGILTDEGRWTAKYWEQLKLDLMKNFSVTRFEHMILVAKVVYADKIERLLGEREAAAFRNKKDNSKNIITDAKKTPITDSGKTAPAGNCISGRGASVSPKRMVNPSAGSTLANDASKQLSEAELQEKRIAEKQRELEAENRRIAAQEAGQRARIEAAKRESANRQSMGRASGSKKALGIVLAVIIIVVVMLIVIVF